MPAPPPEDIFPFERLPAECRLHVLSFLDEEDKCRCALVCLSWSRLVRSRRLWREADYRRRPGPPARRGLLVSGGEFRRWRTWVRRYTRHLVWRRAGLRRLRASFDLADRRHGWAALLGRLLDSVHCRDLRVLDLDWTFTLLEPLDLSHQDRITKVDQVSSFQALLSRLTRTCPRISQVVLPFDWSVRSVSLLTRFQRLRVLELRSFWVFRGVAPAALQTLAAALPDLRSLTLQVLVPLGSLGVTYSLESRSLEFLDVSPSRGLVWSRFRLPALLELRARRAVRGVTLDRRARLRIQSRWPCLDRVLRDGAPRLQVLNGERLSPTWGDRGDQGDGRLGAVLDQCCYCPDHLDSWLW
uniref:Si:dkey-12e7.1 n=1 Tax=Salarias fasciatus TaxID=181472 RepID=A0A672I1E3_SALFA